MFLKYGKKTDQPVEPIYAGSSKFLLSLHLMNVALEMLIEQGVEEPDPERQYVIAEALLARRLHQMVGLSSETYTDTSLITCAEYQVFLQEQLAHDKYFQPDHWSSYHFLSGQGHTPVLGVRSSDARAFCRWLTERELGPWRYRLPEEGELEGEKIPDRLPLETGYWLNEDRAFAWSRNDRVLPSTQFQESLAELFLIIDFALDHARILVNNRSDNLEQALALSVALDRARGIALNAGGDLASTLMSARDLAFNLLRGSSFVPDLAFDLQRISYLSHDLAFALDRTLTGIRNLEQARMSILQITSSLLLERRQKQTQRKVALSRFEQNQFKADENQRSIQLWGNLYMSLIIIEERIKGNFPAHEGILIVKEQK